MTYDNTSTEDQTRTSAPKSEEERVDDELETSDSTLTNHYQTKETINTSKKTTINSNEHHATNGNGVNCYNQVLDDEIRSRLDKLNALSDLINSLERQFDEANSVFRETLKCSTTRLSSIAKALGAKSIRQGRVYHEVRLSVEQNQSDCQSACVQFEQANNEHQFAKMAIKNAELRLKEIASETSIGVLTLHDACTNSIEFNKLNLSDDSPAEIDYPQQPCDMHDDPSDANTSTIRPETTIVNQDTSSIRITPNLSTQITDIGNEKSSSSVVTNAAKLSEDLNQAIMVLIEAERKRGQSEMQHLDRANKLMIAQENLMKLEREYGPSIRRSQLYFDEAKRFNAKLNSVKGDICRISENILAAKQSYAQTLSELEQFSDDLHDSSQLVAS